MFQAGQSGFPDKYHGLAFFGGVCSAPNRDARLAKNRVTKLDAHIALARQPKRCKDAGRRRKVAGGCVLALRGSRGPKWSNFDRKLIQNRSFIGPHSVCVCARWGPETHNLHRATAFGGWIQSVPATSDIAHGCAVATRQCQ